MIIKIDPVYAGVRQVYTVRSRYVHPKKLSVHQANGYRMLTRQFFLILVIPLSLFFTIEGMQQQAQAQQVQAQAQAQAQAAQAQAQAQKAQQAQAQAKTDPMQEIAKRQTALLQRKNSKK
jgi:regulator of protease activity HflC (stomatin/prohibitin superfamily)